MTHTQHLEGTSFESFADAAVVAMGEAPGPEAETFTVESMSIERGGIVGRPQFRVTLRRDHHG